MIIDVGFAAVVIAAAVLLFIRCDMGKGVHKDWALDKVKPYKHWNLA